MTESIWDEIWNKQISRGLLLYQPEADPRWVVDRDWFKEVKAEGDRLNNQLEAIKTYIAKLRGQAEKTGDLFERDFCTGIADNLEKILEAETNEE